MKKKILEGNHKAETQKGSSSVIGRKIRGQHWEGGKGTEAEELVSYSEKGRICREKKQELITTERGWSLRKSLGTYQNQGPGTKKKVTGKEI